MTTKFSGIVAALVSALVAAPAVSTQVDRARQRPIPWCRTDQQNTRPVRPAPVCLPAAAMALDHAAAGGAGSATL